MHLPPGGVSLITNLSVAASYLSQLREADQRLFRAVISDSTHVLRKNLPEVRQLSYNLRPRPHGFLLPSKDDRNLSPGFYTKTCINFPLAAKC